MNGMFAFALRTLSTTDWETAQISKRCGVSFFQILTGRALITVKVLAQFLILKNGTETNFRRSKFMSHVQFRNVSINSKFNTWIVWTINRDEMLEMEKIRKLVDRGQESEHAKSPQTRKGIWKKFVLILCTLKSKDSHFQQKL
jgi:hypothetical protein